MDAPKDYLFFLRLGCNLFYCNILTEIQFVYCVVMISIVARAEKSMFDFCECRSRDPLGTDQPKLKGIVSPPRDRTLWD